MDPILGSLFAAGLQGIFGLGATGLANRYNSPKQQLKRLRKAGLPLSYMYQGKVNQQSSVPSLSIDPDLGTVESFKASQQLKTDQAQIDALKQSTRRDEYAADILEGERDWMNEVSDIDSERNFKRGPITNQMSLLDIERAQKLSNRWIKQREQELTTMFAGLEVELFGEGVQKAERLEALALLRQKTANMIKQSELMKQLGDIRSLEAEINKNISDDIENMPELIRGFYSLLMKLFSKTGGR